MEEKGERKERDRSEFDNWKKQANLESACARGRVTA
jgi:hypothetical protein